MDKLTGWIYRNSTEDIPLRGLLGRFMLVALFIATARAFVQFFYGF